MKHWLLSLLFFLSLQVLSQDTIPSQSISTPQQRTRQWVVSGLMTATYGGSFAVLSQAWYDEYAKESFHTFNDSREWLQVDKFGHAWTAYHTSRLNTAAWQWAGVSRNKAVWLGTGTSMLYMAGIEYLDGRSAKWGWSWSDIAANTFGAALFATQELTSEKQAVSLKFSAFPKTYKEHDLRQRADDLFGRSFQGKLLKDYNAQTYWLSANVKSLFAGTSLPAWLNISVGYGADGMFGGFENKATDQNGVVTFDRTHVKRYRQWYLAPDVDFTRIRTGSKFLRTIFLVANLIKFPSPAITLSKGKLGVKALAY